MYHGSGRPPNEWGIGGGRLEEIMLLKKMLEDCPPKYEELVGLGMEEATNNVISLSLIIELKFTRTKKT